MIISLKDNWKNTILLGVCSSTKIFVNFSWEMNFWQVKIWIEKNIFDRDSGMSFYLRIFSIYSIKFMMKILPKIPSKTIPAHFKYHKKVVNRCLLKQTLNHSSITRFISGNTSHNNNKNQQLYTKRGIHLCFYLISFYFNFIWSKKPKKTENPHWKR